MHLSFRGGLFAITLALCAATAQAQTLDRIRGTGAITFGYLAGDAPFSDSGEGGTPTGFTVGLCGDVAEAAKGQLGLSELAVNWVEVAPADVASALAGGEIDLVCSGIAETLGRRETMSFSIPVFPGGTGALMRNDAPAALREILTYGARRDRAIWRADPARTLLGKATFAVLPGTVAEAWLTERATSLQLTSTVMGVDDFGAGVAAVENREADVFFGQIPNLLARAADPAAGGRLIVLPRLFTHEPLALPMARGDEDFRLLVDSAISAAFSAPDFHGRAEEWFGPMGDILTAFYEGAPLSQ